MWSGLLIRFYPEPSGGFSVDDLICFEAEGKCIRKGILKLEFGINKLMNKMISLCNANERGNEAVTHLA